ncbi:HupE/UreJ family protein [Gynuella sunshinyii]|uniref:HupE / UreJ protein n=1 Tax=Gynuella sunshinyii YC6258 TaxID=1445510 RepID=A0A0C5VQE2_9GAMM|nr:HupE/UreJ family protein [Gynuella sunshinyii]AJQ92499.1 hypothetical Protein YC6258_00449 [Gynuella sunshinyii YC6258]
MRLCYRILLLTFMTGWSQAHDVLTSSIFFDFRSDMILAEMHVPLDQLHLAAPEFGSKTQIDLDDDHQQAISKYLSQHIQLLSAPKKALPMKVDKLQQIQIDQQPFLYIELKFPISDTNTLVFKSDVILHQVVTHRTLVSVRSDFKTATFSDAPRLIGVLRYKHKDVLIDREQASIWQGFLAILSAGMHHIAEGNDHLLFLCCLLLPAPLARSGFRWTTAVPLGTCMGSIVKIVTAFTLAHSLTLALASTQLLKVPSRPVEILVAASILVSAIHAIRPVFGANATAVAAGFGLIHGLAFASEMAGRGFTGLDLIMSLAGFNIGIEIMQLLIVGALMPWLILSSRSHWYSILRITGSALAIMVSLAWIAERTWNMSSPVDAWIQVLRSEGMWIYLFLTAIACASVIWSKRYRSPDLNKTL